MSKGVIFSTSHPVILAYPNLMQARQYKAPNGRLSEPRFDAMLLFTNQHPDLGAMGAAMQQAAAMLGIALPHDFHWCGQPGTLIAQKAAQKQRDASYFNDFYVVQAHTGEKIPPGLTAVINGQAKDLHGEERIVQAPKYFYGGAEVFAQLNFVPYPAGNGPPGLTAYLQVITSLGRGERNPKLEAGAKSGSAVHADAIRQHVGNVQAVGSPMSVPGLPGAGYMSPQVIPAQHVGHVQPVGSPMTVPGLNLSQFS